MSAGSILQKVKILSKSKTLQQAIVLLSGTAGVQVIGLLSQPILARLYSPAEFGEFAFLNSMMAILTIAACGRYEAGIVLAKKLSHAKNLFQLSQLILLGYSLLLSFLIYFSPESLKSYFSRQGLSFSLLWILPVMVIFSGYWQIVHNWLIRFEQFSQLSLALTFQRLLIFLSAVAAFYLPFTGNGLVFSLFAGFTCIFIISLFLQRQTWRTPLKVVRKYAYHFRDFPVFSVPTLFLNMFMVHLPVFWITFFYSKENAGYYTVAYSLISVPSQIICVSIGNIFYQRVAQSKKAFLLPLFIKYCKLYAVLIVPAVVIAAFFGEHLTQLFLGDNWIETGKMVSTLAPIMLIQGINSLCMYMINVLRKQHLLLILQASQLALWIFSFTTGLYFGDFFISLKMIVLFNSFHLFFTVYKVLKYTIPSHDSHSHRTLANG